MAPAIMNIQNECIAAIPKCPPGVRRLQKYAVVCFLVYVCFLLICMQTLQKFPMVFWEKLQQITSNTDVFDSLFTFVALSKLHIPQLDTALAFLDEFQIPKVVSLPHFAKLTSLYEERAYVVLMVGLFLC